MIEKLTNGIIVKVKHPALSKQGKKMFVNKGFLTSVLLWLDKAHSLGITVFITSSFRWDSNDLTGNIVNPAKMSNHFIGFAFDCNLVNKDGTWWNSHKLGNPKEEIKELINYAIKDIIQMRWGGLFLKKDTVHFDMAINIHQPEIYKFYYNKLRQLRNNYEDNN